MQQFDVSHPGKIIARELAEMGISINRFIDETGIQLAFLEGKMTLTAEQAVLIAAIMGSTPDFWLRLQHSYDLRQQKNKAETGKYDDHC
ncbi:HigA family addiction module antidote protein [Salmonella enterica]|uniref:Addiction module antidote protein, HigA family n=2 Tax=Salmonella enterica TaxID=28901 RepID=A0A606C4I6_SALSE|nr:HigA family addiction module antitoxin [Salmonella enterica]EBY0373278.1 addiction module antidote protein, HigA family [Salmonella enterica subsp. enterica serovar Toulon]ECC3617517.1 addiction module antidote protein, HigA family [Salmonella enterica subsp. enterica]ECF6859144.1 addiction module antidote protein, HigA family [Salmonella enterica subsp. enterica serovar Labadi]EJX6013563.1 HigA family addiction module antidote protein [Salmonella enterica subsp. enterica serovar Gateshead]